jgi:hypothetical protein
MRNTSPNCVSSAQRNSNKAGERAPSRAPKAHPCSTSWRTLRRSSSVCPTKSGRS